MSTANIPFDNYLFLLLANNMDVPGPGGYLQWVDCAAHDCVVKGPDGVNPTHAQRYMDIFQSGMMAVGKTPKYVRTAHPVSVSNNNLSSIAALKGIFQKSGLADCEEQIFTLVNPKAREDVNVTVVDGITHFLLAALNLGKKGLVGSEEEIVALRRAALDDFRDLGCYYCYDVHVVVGRK